MDLEPPVFTTVQKELESIRASAGVHALLVAEGPDALDQFQRFARSFNVSTAMPPVLYLATESGLGDRIGER